MAAAFQLAEGVFHADLDAEVGDRQPARLAGVVAVGVALDDAGDGQQPARLDQQLVLVLALDVERFLGEPRPFAPVHQHAERLLTEPDVDLFGGLQLAVEPLLFVEEAAVALDFTVAAADAGFEEGGRVGFGQAAHFRLGRQGAAVVVYAGAGRVGGGGGAAGAVGGQQEAEGQAKQQARHDGSSVRDGARLPRTGDAPHPPQFNRYETD